jgi:hypothetical protein
MKGPSWKTEILQRCPLKAYAMIGTSLIAMDQPLPTKEWMIPSFPRPVGPIAPILDSCPYVPLLATLIATIPEAALLGLFESDLRKKAVRAGELESAFL